MAWFTFIDPAWSAPRRAGFCFRVAGPHAGAPHGRNTRLLNPAAGWAGKEVKKRKSNPESSSRSY